MASCSALEVDGGVVLGGDEEEAALLVLHEQVLRWAPGHLLLDRLRFGHREDGRVLHGLGRDAERGKAIQELLRGQMGQD